MRLRRALQMLLLILLYGDFAKPTMISINPFGINGKKWCTTAAISHLSDLNNRILLLDKENVCVLNSGGQKLKCARRSKPLCIPRSAGLSDYSENSATPSCMCCCISVHTLQKGRRLKVKQYPALWPWRCTLHLCPQIIWIYE